MLNKIVETIRPPGCPREACLVCDKAHKFVNREEPISFALWKFAFDVWLKYVSYPVCQGTQILREVEQRGEEIFSVDGHHPKMMRLSFSEVVDEGNIGFSLEEVG